MTTNLYNIDTNNYDDANYQLPEGDNSRVATTNAPMELQYIQPTHIMVAMIQLAIKLNDISDLEQVELTVPNGQVSGTITAISDNTPEDGELRQVGAQAGDYSNIGKSKVHIADQRDLRLSQLVLGCTVVKQ